MKNYPLSYLLLRLGIGTSMLGHGLARFPKLSTFSQGIVEQFAQTWLPEVLVLAFSYILPFAEFSMGLLLLLGLFTHPAAVAGGVVMILLIFGSCLIEQWGPLPSQMIHLLFFIGLLLFIEYNRYSLDHYK
ncbi:MAG: DoxX family membrane protein [Bacteroidia bacterium]|nr:DoxX family membrane protein [Bacteroidia bacterium]